MVMNNGGIRSLVATGLVLREQAPGGSKQRVTLLHVRDGRESQDTRTEHTRRQAEHVGLTRIVELKMEHLYGEGRLPDGGAMGTLAASQTLLAGLATARRMQAQRLVWPASLDGDAAAIAAMTERLMLTEQLAKLELGEQGTPSLETPLLEMTDPQVIELGVSMGMGKLWGLAWSCAGGGPQACGVCVGCRRRRQALEAGGIVEGEAPGKRSRRAG